MNSMLETFKASLVKLGLDDTTIAFIVIACITMFFLVKFFQFLFNRIIDKEEQQFELINKFIAEDGYLDKVKSQPHIIKQIVFRRVFWFRKLSLKEIDYLIEQHELPYSIHELHELREASLVKFSEEENKYLPTSTRLNRFWINHFTIANLLWLALFIAFMAFILILKVLTKSTPLFIISLSLMCILEIWLLNKVIAIRTFIRIFGSIEK